MTRRWYERAQEDLLAGQAILKATMPSYGTAAFHAQQAAEKALKALLTRHGTPFRKTHNITELLRLAEPNAPTIANDLAAATRLTPFAVEGRYAVDAPPVAQPEATRQLDLARRVLETVWASLKPYLEVEPPAVQD